MKNMVGDLNVCSKKGLSERFDSTIGAATVLMPFGGACPVSYTHLGSGGHQFALGQFAGQGLTDGLEGIACAGDAHGLIDVAAVSYTHLDVYKRQR